MLEHCTRGAGVGLRVKQMNGQDESWLVENQVASEIYRAVLAHKGTECRKTDSPCKLTDNPP